MKFNGLTKLIKVREHHEIQYVNELHRKSILGTTAYVCSACLHNLLKSSDVTVVDENNSLSAGEITVEKLKLYPKVHGILNQFLDFQDKAAKLGNLPYFDALYIMSDLYVPGEFRNNKLNIVVSLKAFDMIGYFCWAVREGKSLLHLWPEEHGRSKFWNSFLTKLLIGLGKVHARSENCNIWVMGYGRIVSIEAFTHTPPNIVKLNGPVILTKVIR